MTNRQQVNDEDFEFLAVLAGMQKALISSCVSPVVIWRQEEGGHGNRGLAMYYDCVDAEKAGLEVMKGRIRDARDDILRHVDFHKAALEAFVDMDGAMLVNNRQTFSAACSRVCEKTREYANLVMEHGTRNFGNEFLTYPSCPRGHYFHIWQGNLVSELGFNPEHSELGVQGGLKSIQEGLTDFRIRTDKLPYVAMPFAADDGAGFYDSNFRQALSTTLLLLERAGLKI